MQRFQELNRQLLEKVKDTEQSMIEREGLSKGSSEEINKLKKEIQILKSEKQ